MRRTILILCITLGLFGCTQPQADDATQASPEVVAPAAESIVAPDSNTEAQPTDATGLPSDLIELLISEETDAGNKASAGTPDPTLDDIGTSTTNASVAPCGGHCPAGSSCDAVTDECVLDARRPTTAGRRRREETPRRDSEAARDETEGPSRGDTREPTPESTPPPVHGRGPHGALRPAPSTADAPTIVPVWGATIVASRTKTPGEIALFAKTTHVEHMRPLPVITMNPPCGADPTLVTHEQQLYLFCVSQHKTLQMRTATYRIRPKIGDRASNIVLTWGAQEQVLDIGLSGGTPLHAVSETRSRTLFVFGMTLKKNLVVLFGDPDTGWGTQYVPNAYILGTKKIQHKYAIDVEVVPGLDDTHFTKIWITGREHGGKKRALVWHIRVTTQGIKHPGVSLTNREQLFTFDGHEEILGASLTSPILVRGTADTVRVRGTTTYIEKLYSTQYEPLWNYVYKTKWNKLNKTEQTQWNQKKWELCPNARVIVDWHLQNEVWQKASPIQGACGMFSDADPYLRFGSVFNPADNTSITFMAAGNSEDVAKSLKTWKEYHKPVNRISTLEMYPNRYQHATMFLDTIALSSLPVATYNRGDPDHPSSAQIHLLFRSGNGLYLRIKHLKIGWGTADTTDFDTRGTGSYDGWSTQLGTPETKFIGNPTVTYLGGE
jgi:hypothetical protein